MSGGPLNNICGGDVVISHDAHDASKRPYFIENLGRDYFSFGPSVQIFPNWKIHKTLIQDLNRDKKPKSIKY